MSRILQVEMLGAAAVLLGAFGTAHAAPAFVYTGTDGTQFEMKFSGRTTVCAPDNAGRRTASPPSSAVGRSPANTCRAAPAWRTRTIASAALRP